MIDYYLHKKCSLMFKEQKEDIRCNGCIWLNKEIKKCLFAIDYPFEVELKELEKRIKSVNEKQQRELSEPFRRFKNSNEM